jgi:hypothetical protein
MLRLALEDLETIHNEAGDTQASDEEEFGNADAIAVSRYGGPPSTITITVMQDGANKRNSLVSLPHVLGSFLATPYVRRTAVIHYSSSPAPTLRFETELFRGWSCSLDEWFAAGVQFPLFLVRL